MQTKTVQRKSRDLVLNRTKAQSDEQVVTSDPTVRLIQEVDLVQIKGTCEDCTLGLQAKGISDNMKDAIEAQVQPSIKLNE